MTKALSSRIAVGVFGAPHGVRGELRLKSYTADPLAIIDYTPLTDQTGARRFVFKSARHFKENLLIVRLDGVSDRDHAAALTNSELYIDRDHLPPADEDEFYLADLIGLKAVDDHGKEIGTVLAMHNFGAGDIVELKPLEGGATMMLPFTKAIVPHVDITSGVITLILPDEIEGEEDQNR